MSNYPHNNQKGFTLLEVLLVLAAVAVLASIVIFAINPGRQLAQMRDAKRRADVNLILNAVYQYSIDNNGNFPSDSIAQHSETDCPLLKQNEICVTNPPNNLCGVDLEALYYEQRYLVSIPVDPHGAAFPSDFGGPGFGSGYNIIRNQNNRLTVCAPNTELGSVISSTR